MKRKGRRVPGWTGKCIRCDSNAISADATSSDGILIRNQAQTRPSTTESKRSRAANFAVQNVCSGQGVALSTELASPAGTEELRNEDITRCVDFWMI